LKGGQLVKKGKPDNTPELRAASVFDGKEYDALTR
jgi:hypothetical protein